MLNGSPCTTSVNTYQRAQTKRSVQNASQQQRHACSLPSTSEYPKVRRHVTDGNERDRIIYPVSEVKPLAWFGSPLTADELRLMRARALLQLKCYSEAQRCARFAPLSICLSTKAKSNSGFTPLRLAWAVASLRFLAELRRYGQLVARHDPVAESIGYSIGIRVMHGWIVTGAQCSSNSRPMRRATFTP